MILGNTLRCLCVWGLGCDHSRAAGVRRTTPKLNTVPKIHQEVLVAPTRNLGPCYGHVIATRVLLLVG